MDIMGDSDSAEEEDEDMWGAEVSQDKTHGSGQITFGIIHSKDRDMVVEYEGDDDDEGLDET